LKIPSKNANEKIGEAAPGALLMKRQSGPVVDPRYGSPRGLTRTQQMAKAYAAIPGTTPFDSMVAENTAQAIAANAKI
jgi:hypothetical protein